MTSALVSMAVFAIALVVPLTFAAFDESGKNPSGSWTQMIPTGDPPRGAQYHSGAVVGESLYVVGGLGKKFNQTFYYDVQKNTWNDAKQELPSNFNCADMDAAGGRLFLFGGQNNETGDYSKDLLVLFPHSDSEWKKVQVPHSTGERSGHTATMVSGIIYIFGGWDAKSYYNDLRMFDTNFLGGDGKCPPDSSPPCMWSSITYAKGSDVPGARNDHTMVQYGGNLVLFGGFYHDISKDGPVVDCKRYPDRCTYYNDIWTIDLPQTKFELTEDPSWSQMKTTGPNPEGRFGHTANRIGDSMFVFGGTSKTGMMNDLWEFSLSRSTWVKLTPSGSSPSPRYRHVAGVVSGSIAIFGGLGGNDDVWRYDPALSPMQMIQRNALALPQEPCAKTSDFSSIKTWSVFNFLVSAGCFVVLIVMMRRAGRGTSHALLQ